MNMYIDFTLNSDLQIDGINDFIIDGAPVSGQGTYPLVETFVQILKEQTYSTFNHTLFMFEGEEGKLNVKLTSRDHKTEIESEHVVYNPKKDEEKVREKGTHVFWSDLFQLRVW